MVMMVMITRRAVKCYDEKPRIYILKYIKNIKNLASIFSSIAEPQLADLQVKTVAPVEKLGNQIISTYGEDLSVWFGNDDNHIGDTLRVWVQILHPFEQADFLLISPNGGNKWEKKTSNKKIFMAIK